MFLHDVFKRGMGIKKNSSQLRVIYPNVVTKGKFYDNETGYKYGDLKIVSTLTKYAIPSMSLFIGHG